MYGCAVEMKPRLLEILLVHPVPLSPSDLQMEEHPQHRRLHVVSHWPGLVSVTPSCKGGWGMFLGRENNWFQG